ncbi:DUF6221 family protein [Streptomyces scabiei]|uniref:DUF6221 family protein n=1 Tax=Streptomyces scabiei TaxID=1930 RepID=UPI000765A6DB|nr:DUF6221 family protein [Streptomyces scabiei]MDX2999929.1 DUF6221 family protein [Streptomyces scabiei]MDX3050842.1 DUF6221 family protein [Streptomyces scabiei]
MTAQREDILAWLSNAISEREEAGRAALAFGDAFAAGREAPDCVYGTGPGGPYMRVTVPGFDGQTEAAVAHFALHSPESVLRRCAADRKLLELHGGNMHSCPATDETDYLDEWTHFDYSQACPVVELLAASYGRTARQTPPIEGDQVT